MYAMVLFRKFLYDGRPIFNGLPNIKEEFLVRECREDLDLLPVCILYSQYSHS